MRRRLLALALLPVLAAAATPFALAQRSYTPGPENISLPQGWETRFLRFATLDNPQRKIIRNFYVNPEAFAAARPGQPLPNGTLIILADQKARLAPDGSPLLDQQGRFIPEPGWVQIGAQERQPGWGLGYAAGSAAILAFYDAVFASTARARARRVLPHAGAQ